MQLKKSFIEALCQELILRKDYLDGEPIETIYFGGGTPSLLDEHELGKILDTIHQHYPVQADELTIEINPDDVDTTKLLNFQQLGFNRLSIGIQSLDDRLLSYMNRSHNSDQAMKSVQCAQEIGFDNISIDLIYGIPGLGISDWNKSLHEIGQLHIQHISAYHLTIEEGTVFGHWQQKGKLKEQEDEDVIEQIEAMNEYLHSQGFERYEISNFGLPGYFSKHNSSYWKRKKYLGVGPSAHSFDHTSRQWNVANNLHYIQKINTGNPFFEREIMTPKDHINELLLTGLRTIWGIDTTEFPPSFLEDKAETIHSFVNEGKLLVNKNNITLTNKGKLFADEIAMHLMVD